MELSVPWWQESCRDTLPPQQVATPTLTLGPGHVPAPLLGEEEQTSWLRSEVRSSGSHLAAPSLGLCFLTYSVRR